MQGAGCLMTLSEHLDNTLKSAEAVLVKFLTENPHSPFVFEGIQRFLREAKVFEPYERSLKLAWGETPGEWTQVVLEHLETKRVIAKVSFEELFSNQAFTGYCLGGAEQKTKAEYRDNPKFRPAIDKVKKLFLDFFEEHMDDAPTLSELCVKTMTSPRNSYLFPDFPRIHWELGTMFDKLGLADFNNLQWFLEAALEELFWERKVDPRPLGKRKFYTYKY